MNKLFTFLLLVLSLTTHASEMTAIPTAKNIIAEVWCVEGYKVFYVEKTTNETFQFFQLTQNSGIAVKGIECDGSEVKKIGKGRIIVEEEY